MSLTRLNTRSVEYTGDVTLPANSNRGYLFLYVTAGSYTMEFGDGGGAIPLAVSSSYEPVVCPTSKLVLTANNPADTIIIHSDQQV